MFGLFKSNKVTKEQNELLLNIFENLPAEYKSFADQLKAGILNRVFRSSDMIQNFIGFSYHGRISKAYEKRESGYYMLSSIAVYDRASKQMIPVNIYLSAGLITGYSTGTVSNPLLDSTRIDVSNFLQISLDTKNIDFESVKKLLSPTDIELVDPAEVYVINLDGKDYFHLKDLGDGDFVGVDDRGILYEITHDPYEIKRISQPLTVFLQMKLR